MATDLYGRELKRRRKDKQEASTAASSVASSSFLGLKAELARRKGVTEHERGGRGRERTDKSPANTDVSSKVHDDPYARAKSGVAASRKSVQHVEGEPTDSRVNRAHLTRDATPSESYTENERRRRGNLARKTTLYDQLRKGRSGGLDPTDIEGEGKLGGLVDWERLREDEAASSGGEDAANSSSSGSTNGHRSQNRGDTGDLVEYTDSFGRTRSVPRSQVPMEYLIQLQQQETDSKEDDHTTLYGPQTQFPVFARNDVPRRLAEEEAANSADRHFDSQHEIRNRGAAFFRFDGGADGDGGDGRQRQMDELMERRRETQRQRGEVDGSDDQGSVGKARPADERLEQRRRFVAEKTRQLRQARGEEEEGQEANDERLTSQKASATAVDRFLDSTLQGLPP
ncbi:unnamed protein product [Jaminaea pallidilutea]